MGAGAFVAKAEIRHPTANFRSMKRIVVGVAVLLGLATGCSSTVASSKASTLGADVVVNSAVSVTPAGVTRTDFDKVTTALAAKDTTGLQQLVTAGQVVAVDQCATAKVIDTAAGGERQVRIETDPGTPALVGQAVWVDVLWLKDPSATCP
jgi:hypothetical protein